MTENQLRGVNALRCAVTSGGYQAWYFIASAWWTLKFVGQESLLEDQILEYYPYLCTCTEDTTNLSKFFGGDEKKEGDNNNAIFTTCSEAAEKVKTNKEEAKSTA